MGLRGKPGARPSEWLAMAIYSLHHAAIGKATQPRPHTAAAHIRYIARKSACSRLIGERMPVKSAQAQKWMRQQEADDRKNARVCDKVLLALPRELNAEQRAALVRSFAEKVTAGRASWLAAFHDRGEDKHNPHCHLVVRDRDPDTGKRVCKMSERGSTEMLRLLWEQHANAALAQAGREERIDRRTLVAQGVKRRPTIHEGLSSREMIAKGRRVRSRPVNVRNGAGARSPERVVDYRRFDRGRSRPAYNRHIQETEADYWAAIDADRRAWESAALKVASNRPGNKMSAVSSMVARDGPMSDEKKRPSRGKPEPEMFTTRTGPGGEPSYRAVVQKPSDTRDPMKDFDRQGRPKKSLSRKISGQYTGASRDVEQKSIDKNNVLERWRRDREKDKDRSR